MEGFPLARLHVAGPAILTEVAERRSGRKTGGCLTKSKRHEARVRLTRNGFISAPNERGGERKERSRDGVDIVLRLTSKRLLVL